MRNHLRGISLVLFVLMAVGTLSGLVAAVYRLRAERRNRLVEIGLEWQLGVGLDRSLWRHRCRVLARADRKGLNAADALNCCLPDLHVHRLWPAICYR